MANVIDYASPGPFTSLDGVNSRALESSATDPVDICMPVRDLFIQPTDAQPLNLRAERFDDNQIRPVNSLVRQLLALNPAPLTTARELEERVVGTCRHFAVLGCALLRRRGIAEHLGKTILPHLHDLRPENFLTGGEAWAAYRRGEIDCSRFGVHGTEYWGPAEIRGNAVRDLAALNKIEPLPWDEWGRMTDAFAEKTGADYDALLDELASVCAADDPAAVSALYEHEDLRVPENLVR